MISGRTIRKVVRSQSQQMGNNTIRVPFPTPELKMVDPFLLLHHFGPYYTEPGSDERIPPHPHKGFETVTILLDGEFEHYDSTGGHGILKAGDVQWMTAGAGIVHSEGPSPEMLSSGGFVHGIQLWVNLPSALKLTSPGYQDLSETIIPVITQSNSHIRLVAGEMEGKKGPAHTFTPLTLAVVKLAKGDAIRLEVNKNQDAALYTIDGDFRTFGELIREGELVHFKSDGETLQINSENGATLLLLAGEPINEPVASYGPFVMNTSHELIEAIEEYQRGDYGDLTY